MGIISKRIHQRKTDQLKQPVQGRSALPPEDIYAEAVKVAESWVPGTGVGGFLQDEQYRYWIRQRSDGSRSVVCGQPPLVSGARKFDWDSQVANTTQWEAQLEVRRDPKSNDRRIVHLQLGSWATRDGKMIRQKAFEGFRDRFFEQLRSTDPSFEMLISQ